MILVSLKLNLELVIRNYRPFFNKIQKFLSKDTYSMEDHNRSTEMVLFKYGFIQAAMYVYCLNVPASLDL